MRLPAGLDADDRDQEPRIETVVRRHHQHVRGHVLGLRRRERGVERMQHVAVARDGIGTRRCRNGREKDDESGDENTGSPPGEHRQPGLFGRRYEKT
jgi:hypothetical protein